MNLFVTNMSIFFFTVCLREARKAGSDISQPQQTHVLLTRKSLMSRYEEIALWQFINILSGGAGSAQDLPPHI